MNIVTDDQDDVIYRGPSGNVCAVKRGCKTLLGYDIELNLSQVSPQLTDVITGQPQVLGFDGVPIGQDDCSIPCKAGFALELWSELIEATCSATGQQRYLYTLLPFITNAYLNDLEIGNEAVSFQMLGSTRAGGSWGTGPFNVVATNAANTPGKMLTPLGTSCHRRMFLTTISPPAPSCDYITVPATP